MKKQLFMGGFIAFSIMMNAQGWDGGSAIQVTPLQIGIGPGGPPVSQLDINANDPNPYSGGAIINQWNTNGSSALHFNTYNNGGNGWGLYSLGNNNHVDAANAGDFTIYDENSGIPALNIRKRTGYVGIGTTVPGTRLEVREGAAPTAAWISADAFHTGAGLTTGLVSQANGWNLSTGIANIGIDCSANSMYMGQTNGTSFGIWGTATAGNTAWGGRFEGQGTAGSSNVVGVYATTNGVGNCWAAYFDGDLNVNGNAYCTLSAWSSDRKLKKDIKPLNHTLEKIKLMNPSTYLFKTDEFKGMNLPEEKQMGLIAQELEEVFPELIHTVKSTSKTDREGKVTYTSPQHKAVNYVGLIPVLIAGIQEQQTTIDQQSQINADLQQQLNEQKQLINSLSQKVAGATGLGANGNIETGFQMSQNEPNPFTHETVVNYTLPQSTGNAFMAVYDLSGKQIASFPIIQKGTASITLTSEKLAAGIYIYSVVADGKVIDSKRMIVAEK